jgi:hypothetical protein
VVTPSPAIPPVIPPPPVSIPAVPPVKTISLPVEKQVVKPVEGNRSKTPAPLLSRLKRQKAPAPHLLEGDKASARKERPRWQRVVFRILIYILVIGLISGTGSLIYLNLRQTELAGVIVAPGLEIMEVNVVRDFRNDVDELRTELFLARDPLLDQLRTNQEMEARARADVSGVGERLKLLRQEAENIRGEIESVGRDSEKATEQVWGGEDEKLNKEFEQKLKEFGQRLQTRAQQLGLKYAPNEEFALPEVWVSNYRYALYDVAKEVKTADERLWADQQLGLWRDYEKEWDTRKAQLRLKVEDLQKNAGGRINRLKERLVELEQRAGDAEIELKPLATELEDRERALNEVQTAEASLDEPKYQQILQIPAKGVLRKVALQKDGTFRWQHIDLEEDKFKPKASYWLWIRARKGEDEAWALIPFTLERYWQTHLTIKEGMFVPVREFLKKRSLIFYPES